MQALLKFIFFLPFCCFFLDSYATHLVGGEMTYVHLGNNDYEITLTIYRDCGPENANNTNFDNTPHIGVYSGGNLVNQFDMQLTSVGIEEVDISLANPCFVLPPDLCIEKAVMTQVVNLQPSLNGYTIVHQRCCRSPGIVNMVNPDDMGMSIFAQIPPSDIAPVPNNSAQFNNQPPVALCLNAQFVFDHGATDVDGDQLVYSWCTPSTGGGSNLNGPENSPDFVHPNPPSGPPFTSTVWSAGFNQNYQITSNPGFQINAQTGEITGTATALGRFAIGVCVQEYRDGVLINTVIRDFQYLVTVCDPTVISAVSEQSPEQTCEGLTFTFSHQSINALEVLWDFGDPFSNLDNSLEQSPTYTYSDTGQYVVTLIINQSWTCADTSSAIYQVYPSVEPIIEPMGFDCVDGIPTYSFEVGGNFDADEAIFEWTFPDGQVANGITQFDIPITDTGPQTVVLQTNQSVCEVISELVLDIPPPPEAAIAEQTEFCNGFTYQFENESVNATAFQWDFGVANDGLDLSMVANPAFTYPEANDYNVRLIASAQETCADTAYRNIEINPLLAPSFDAPPAQCFEGNSFNFAALGYNEADAQIDWNFGASSNPGTSTQAAPTEISYAENGAHPIVLTISENGCTRDFTSEINVYPNPEAGVNVWESRGCVPFLMNLFDNSTAGTALTHFWDFGDGATSSATHPTHVYEFPGTYSITHTVSTTFGCIDESTITLPNLVVVDDVPFAGFSASPYEVDVISPYIDIESEAFGHTDCYYSFGDGSQTETDCDVFQHELIDAGYIDITQTVVNAAGCQNTVTQQVFVQGHLLYVPNSFTPNQDGINEVFRAVGVGLSAFQIEIFNRWGEVVFKSNDINEPWRGEDVRAYVMSGLYPYKIIVADAQGISHLYQGYIQVVR